LSQVLLAKFVCGMLVRILKTRNIAKITSLFTKFLAETTTFTDSKPNATASP